MSDSQIDFEKIKSTRKKLKISLDDASVGCALSTTQIQSIEENKDVGFFNAHFKKIATLKYIKFLGLTPEDLMIQMPLERKTQKDIEMTKKDFSIPKNSNDIDSPKKLHLMQKNLIIGLAAILLIVLFWFFFTNNDSHQTDYENTLNNDSKVNLDEGQAEENPEELNQSPIEATPKQDFSDQKTENKTEDLAHTQNIPATLPKEEKINATNSICPLDFINQTVNFKEYKTYRIPEKPDSYIHIVSTGAQKLCVIDASEKLKEYDLSAPEKITISGKPPYKLWLDPNQTEVYFQGWRVPLSAEDTFYSINKYIDPNLTSDQ